MEDGFRIAAFYEFRPMPVGDGLLQLRDELRDLMRDHDIKGTILLAGEGYNASVSGAAEQLDAFIGRLSLRLDTAIEPKYSSHPIRPFRKTEVRIKKEIVSLRRPVSFAHGTGTLVDPREWNELISRPNVVLLDARNEYEYECGTFPRAIDPGTAKFSELPAFIEARLADAKDKDVAMFCTGGIRCEKLAPYLLEQGFTRVFHLKGGILKYLEEVPTDEQLWTGECFVFDDRISVDRKLKKGSSADPSLANSSAALSEEAQ